MKTELIVMVLRDKNYEVFAYWIIRFKNKL